MKSLQQWSEDTGIKPTTPTTECQAVSLVISESNRRLRELYRLTDYAVSSRSGAVVWLTPRKKDLQKC